MPKNAAALPVLREDDQPQAAYPGDVCQAGIVRANCRFFAIEGPHACYDCGYRDGLDDGRTLAGAAEEEERWEAMD